MIEIIIFSVLLNIGEIHVLSPEEPKIEARRRSGKGNTKRRRGGNGLR